MSTTTTTTTTTTRMNTTTAVLRSAFHNFKSQNFKLSVSNPKSKYIAYLSVLSQISNCQGLGRKSKHETLKTDRTYYHPACLPDRLDQDIISKGEITPSTGNSPGISTRRKLVCEMLVLKMAACDR